jgi:hypothetical protein
MTDTRVNPSLVSRDPAERRAFFANLGEGIGYFIPPEVRPLFQFAADMTPSATVERASQASQRMFQPDRTAMERFGDFGDMLSETAGVVAPVAVARAAAMPAAQAAQEAFMGFSAPVRAAADTVIERLNQPGQMPETLFSGFGPTGGSPRRSPVQEARVEGTGLTSPAFQRALEITQPTAPASQYLRTLIGNNPRIEQELRWSGAYQQLEALGDNVIPLSDLQSYVGSRADLFSVETLRGRGVTGSVFDDPLAALIAETRVAPQLELEASEAISRQWRPASEFSPIQLEDAGVYVQPGLRANPDQYLVNIERGAVRENTPAELAELRERFFAENYGGRNFAGALRSRTNKVESELTADERATLLTEANRRFNADDLQFYGGRGDTLYSGYVLPGARDYRENIVRINPQVAAVRGTENPTVDSMARSHFNRKMVPETLFEAGGEVPVYHTRTVTLPYRNNPPSRGNTEIDGNGHFIAEAQADAQQGIRNDPSLGVYDVTGSPDVVRDRYRALEDEGRAILNNVEPLAMRWHQLGREAFDLRRTTVGLSEVPPNVQRRLDEIGEERGQLYNQAREEAFSAAGSKSVLQDILDRALRGSFNERIVRQADQPSQYFVPNYAIDEGRFEDIVSSVYPETVEMGLPLSNTSSEWLDHALRRELRVAIDEGRDALILTPGVLPQRYSQGTEGVANFYDDIGPKRMQNLLRQLFGKKDAPELDRVWVQTRDDGWLEAPVIRINDALIDRAEEVGLRNFRDGGEVRGGIGAFRNLARPEGFADGGEVFRGIGSLTSVARGMFGA